MTTAGSNRNAKYIVHLVGPNYNQGEKRIIHELLKKAIVTLLNAAKEMEVESIALPAISCGLFAFPPDDAAEIIIENIIRWCNLPDTGKIKNITIMNFSDDLHMKFSAKFHQMT